MQTPLVESVPVDRRPAAPDARAPLCTPQHSSQRAPLCAPLHTPLCTRQGAIAAATPQRLTRRRR
jgi:hypothetical protein